MALTILATFLKDDFALTFDLLTYVNENRIYEQLVYSDGKLAEQITVARLDRLPFPGGVTPDQPGWLEGSSFFVLGADSDSVFVSSYGSRPPSLDTAGVRVIQAALEQLQKCGADGKSAFDILQTLRNTTKRPLDLQVPQLIPVKDYIQTPLSFDPPKQVASAPTLAIYKSSLTCDYAPTRTLEAFVARGSGLGGTICLPPYPCPYPTHRHN